MLLPLLHNSFPFPLLSAASETLTAACTANGVFEAFLNRDVLSPTDVKKKCSLVSCSGLPPKVFPLLAMQVSGREYHLLEFL